MREEVGRVRRTREGLNMEIEGVVIIDNDRWLVVEMGLLVPSGR